MLSYNETDNYSYIGSKKDDTVEHFSWFKKAKKGGATVAGSKGFRKRAGSVAGSKGFRKRAGSMAGSKGFRKRAGSITGSKGFRKRAGSLGDAVSSKGFRKRAGSLGDAASSKGFRKSAGRFKDKAINLAKKNKKKIAALGVFGGLAAAAHAGAFKEGGILGDIPILGGEGGLLENGLFGEEGLLPNMGDVIKDPTKAITKPFNKLVEWGKKNLKNAAIAIVIGLIVISIVRNIIGI
jgi:hypothetical protein